MRYLFIKRCDGIYDFIPLEQITFNFIEIDDHEYRVEITVGRRSETLFEKRVFVSTTMYACMKRVAALPDGCIITTGDLFEE